MHLISRDEHDVASRDRVLAAVEDAGSADLPGSGHRRVNQAAIVNSFRRSVADKLDLVDSFMRFVGPNRAVIDDLVDARPTGEPQCR